MYDLELTAVWFSNGTRYRFPGEIAEILDFEDAIIVRLAPGAQVTHRNVYALDYGGNLLWQVPQPLSFVAHSPYVNISRNGGNVDVINWDGRILTIHPKLGRILEESVCASGPTLSRRTSSVRRWI